MAQQLYFKEVVTKQESFSEDEDELLIKTQKVPLIQLKNYVSQAKICGSTVNPLKVAEELSNKLKQAGTLYYSTTDNMPRAEKAMLQRGDFSMNQYATSEEEGPGYVYAVVFKE